MHLAMQPIPCPTGQVHLLVLYKAEMTSVRLSVGRHVNSSGVSACIHVGLGLCTAVLSAM